MAEVISEYQRIINDYKEGKLTPKFPIHLTPIAGTIVYVAYREEETGEGRFDRLVTNHNSKNSTFNIDGDLAWKDDNQYTWNEFVIAHENFFQDFFESIYPVIESPNPTPARLEARLELGRIVEVFMADHTNSLSKKGHGAINLGAEMDNAGLGGRSRKSRRRKSRRRKSRRKSRR